MALNEDISRSEAAAASSVSGRDDRYLFGPVTDFICLGGGSFVLFPIFLILPLGPYEASISRAIVLFAFVINYPHFANSYQIFYRKFVGKAFGNDYDPILRARYLNAGIVVPVALALFFAFSVGSGNVRMLGLGANLMFLLVGWHYVKQGYGILMVDSVLKRQYFQNTEKRLLRINGYVVWLLSWLFGNTVLSRHELFTVRYYTFEAPAALLIVAGAGAFVTGVLTLWILVRRWRANGGSLPVNGVLAYIASLYLWILVFNLDPGPIWLMMVAVLHSLQYLEVVWRYQIGYEQDRSGAGDALFGFLPRSKANKKYQFNFALFVLLGVMLGAMGFWAIPLLLKALVPYDSGTLGPGMFLFVFFIFINVHHYFLDNVMWRRDNPDMRRYLFN